MNVYVVVENYPHENPYIISIWSDEGKAHAEAEQLNTTWREGLSISSSKHTGPYEVHDYEVKEM
jgi:hypothetical protein